MNVYDAAHNLVRAVKNSEEYKEYINKQKKVFQNSGAKEMILDFRKKAMELQMVQMNGEEVDEEKVNQIKKLEEIMMQNPEINNFFMAEMRFSQIMNDVYKILGDGIKIDLGIDESS